MSRQQTSDTPRAKFKVPKRRGRRTFVKVPAPPRPGLERPIFVAGEEIAGLAFLFHFQFDLYVSEDLEDIQTTFVDGHEIRIYPPFWNEEEAFEPSQINLGALPFKPGTVRPDYDKVRLRSLSVDLQRGRAANALRIDILPEPNPDLAARIADQFLGLARWWTRQWWIKRDRRDQFDYLRNQFAVNYAGERVSGVQGYTSFYGGFGIEQPLSLELMQNIRGNITNGRWIPLAFDAFFDGIYFHASRELRRAVLELAIACEAKIAEEAERFAERNDYSAARLNKALSPNDFTAQLKRLPMIGAPLYSDEEPEDYRILRNLKIVRGYVAHGGPPVGKNGQDVDAEAVFEMADATFRLFQWLEGLNGLKQGADR